MISTSDVEARETASGLELPGNGADSQLANPRRIRL